MNCLPTIVTSKLKTVVNTKKNILRNVMFCLLISGQADPANIGVDETMIYDERGSIIGTRIAPAEGNIPIPIHTNNDAEIMSFPTIYAGQRRKIPDGVKISYTDIAKSELRRYDRRACHLPKLFYSFKRSYNEKVYSSYRIAFRKRRGAETTAADVRAPGYINELMTGDQAYSVFQNLRSSPAYWQKQTKRVVSMIRQRGKCGFFITLSAAESKWNELLVMLMKIVKNKDITEAEAANLTPEEKSELVRSDPVTCMVHFQKRFNALKTTLFTNKNGIFHPFDLEDWFTRLEFQLRGSPHVHGLFWIKDAPVYDES